jgi:hypothetical protein
MSPVIRPAAWTTVAALVLMLGVGQADDKPQAKPADPPKKPTVMQRKLAHAQKVLEALALNDFDKIKAEADSLQQCAKEASWQVLKTPKYDLYSNDFIRNLENLQAAAKKKNIDAAALSYVEVTLTCVKCHQYVREERIGAAPELGPLDLKTTR